MIIFRCSSVSAITKTTVNAKLAEVPATTLTDADASKFTVISNGKVNVVTKVEKDFTDINGKTYKLTLTDSLDKTQGSLTVNGVAPATKAVTGSDYDYDYKAPSVVSVAAKGNKSVVVKFDEKMSTAGTALANFKLVKADTPLTDLLAGGTAVLSADKTEVTLTFATALVPAQYTLVLGNSSTVQDLASNAIYNGTEVGFAPTADQLEIKAAPGIATAVYNNGKGELTLTFDKNLSSVDVTKLSINGIELTSADTATTSGNSSVIKLSTATKTKIDAITDALSLTSVKDAYTDGTNATEGETVAISKVTPAVISGGSYNQETNVITLNFDQKVKIADLSKIKINDDTTSDEAVLTGAKIADGTREYTATELATASSTWTFKLSDAEAAKLEATANDKTKLKAYMEAAAVTNDDVNSTPNIEILYAKGGAVSYSTDSTKPFVKGVTFDYVTSVGSSTEGDASALTIELNEKSTVNGTIKIATTATGDANEVDLALSSATTDSKNKISINYTNLASGNVDKLKNLFESGKDIKVFFAKDIITDDNTLKNDEVTFANGLALTYNDYVKPALTTTSPDPIELKDTTHLIVNFTEPMDTATANIVSNYVITDATGANLNVVSAQLQDNKKSVLLTTAAQTANKPYNIKVTGIKDVKGNTINDVTKSFLGTGDVLDTKLAIASGSTVVIYPNAANDIINIKFNNAVDQTAAKVLENYVVFTENTSATDLTKSVSLTGSTITLSADQKTVSIKLANHDIQAGKNYKIVVSNLKDIYGNILDTSAEANYITTIVPTNDATETGYVAEPTAVAFMNADGKATIELTFAEELNKANAENKAGYVVAGVTNQSNIASAVYTPYDATTGKSKVTLTLAEGTTLSGTTSVKVLGGTAGVVTDLSGYKLAADANLTAAVADLVKPTFATTNPIVATANTLTNGDTIVLTFSEPITVTGNVLDERNYTIKVNGTVLSAKANVTGADADTPYVATSTGNTVTLTLGSSYANIVKGDTVEVTVAGDKVSDLAGLTMDTATASVSTVAGTVDNTPVTAELTDPRTVTLTFNTNGVLASTVSKDDFVVDGNVVNAANVSGNVVTLKLAAQAQTGPVTVKPSSTFAIKDDMGNDLTNATLGADTGITTTNTVEDVALAADTASVNAAKSTLTDADILNGNTALDSVKTDLTLPTTGTEGTTISWNVTGNSAVSATGAVTRGTNDVTGNIVATITKGSASDTKTFSVTVKAKTFALSIDGTNTLKLNLDGFDGVTVDTYKAVVAADGTITLTTR